MRLAFVHDFLMYWGGAERVLAGMHRIFPDAPVYTLFAKKQFTNEFFPGAKIRQTWLSYVPLPYRTLLPLFPTTVESLVLDDYDVVISSGSFAKGIITRPHTTHIHYCHTPPRFLWEDTHSYAKQMPLLTGRPFANAATHWLRLWDRQAAARVDRFLANSLWTQQKIRKIYRRTSEVLYPFADVDHDVPAEGKRSYFLLVSRLSRYKHIDLPIRVFSRLGWPLYIVGQGSDHRRLMRMAGSTIKFLGFVPEDELARLYAGARGLIMPGVEDFGLTPIEAMAQGTPVLAFRKGGAMETVVEGKTGEFFDVHSLKNFESALMRLVKREPSYSRSAIAAQAQKFSFGAFESHLRALLDQKTP